MFQQFPGSPGEQAMKVTPEFETQFKAVMIEEVMEKYGENAELKTKIEKLESRSEEVQAEGGGGQ
ncbi:MAG: hypothetical protein GY838_10045 [bacterium]|nr:hypothetical protein [bacterium]